MDRKSYGEYGSPSSLRKDLHVAVWSGGRGEDVIARRAGPSAALETLRRLQEDLHHLDRRLGKLNPQGSQLLESSKLKEELDEPLKVLASGVEALRDAALDRFESLEDHLAALEDNNATAAKHCATLRKRKASPTAASSPPVERANKRLRLDTPESGELTDAEQDASLSKPSKEVSAESGPIATGCIIPAPAASIHSPSPRPMPSKPLATRERRETASTSASAESSSRGIEPKDWFRTPEWALQARLQREPIAEGRDFVRLIEVFRAVLQRDKQAPPVRRNCIVFAEHLAIQIKLLHPDFMKRYISSSSMKWKNFLPVAQQYCALHLVLPPLQRDLKRCKGEYLLLEDLDRPFYDRIVQPPSFDAQTGSLCIELGLHSDAWLRRTTQPALPQTPEPPKRFKQQQQRNSASSLPHNTSLTHPLPAKPPTEVHLPPAPAPDLLAETMFISAFPPLNVPLAPEWKARLAEPTFYYDLVDILRTARDGQAVDIVDVRDALRRCMGGETFRDLLRMCNGLKKLFLLASRYVRLGVARNDPNFITLLDIRYPFFDERDNDAYFASLAGPKQVLPSQEIRKDSTSASGSGWRSGDW